MKQNKILFKFNSSNHVTFFLIIILLFSFYSFTLINVKEKSINVKGSSNWIQKSESDFTDGSLSNLEIVKKEFNVSLRLISTDYNDWFEQKPIKSPRRRYQALRLNRPNPI